MQFSTFKTSFLSIVTVELGNLFENDSCKVKGFVHNLQALQAFTKWYFQLNILQESKPPHTIKKIKNKTKQENILRVVNT